MVIWCCLFVHYTWRHIRGQFYKMQMHFFRKVKEPDKIENAIFTHGKSLENIVFSRLFPWNLLCFQFPAT